MAVGTVFGTVDAVLPAQALPTFWMPPALSAHAARVDWLFNYILCISLFFFLLIVGLMTYFVIRFRRRTGNQEPLPSPSHSTRLEILWLSIIIPVAASMFYFGLDSYVDLAVAPLNCYPINVTGQKCRWLFQYPADCVDEDLHVPVGHDVELTMTSNDLIYSLFIPALRIKRDLVPGRYSRIWFRAEEPGEYPLLCTQYCGTEYSTMRARLIVHPRGEFEQWVATVSNFLVTMPPAEAGRRVYRLRGCRQCHSIDGAGGIGPGFRALFGHEMIFEDGSRHLVDADYIRNVILDPTTVRLPGFEQVMPQIQVPEAEIEVLIALIRSLNDAGDTMAGSSRSPTVLAECGKRLYQRRGCMACHTTDGSVMIGPTFRNLFGHEAVFVDGSRRVADENYLRNCILDPMSVRLRGFEQVMPKIHLTDTEIEALIAFIRSLSNLGNATMAVSRSATAPAPCRVARVDRGG